jgi:FkbM family methyltransferase
MAIVPDDTAIEEAKRIKWVLSIKPGILGEYLVRVLRGGPQRTIFQTSWGVRLYLDPLSNLGSQFIFNSAYEPESQSVFEAVLKEGDTVIDIGANEGAFTCLALRLVGQRGRVIAVEPQPDLRSIIEINCAINNFTNVQVETAALSPNKTEIMHMFPRFNSGATSIVRSYRWRKRSAKVVGIGFTELMQKYGLTTVDFVKIDVEGYEPEVLELMFGSIAAGRIKNVFVDFHESILGWRGIDARKIDEKMTQYMTRTAVERGLSGYVLYSMPGANR